MYDLNQDVRGAVIQLFLAAGGVQELCEYEDAAGIVHETQDLTKFVEGMVLACTLCEGRKPYFNVGKVETKLIDGKVVFYVQAYWY